MTKLFRICAWLALASIIFMTVCPISLRPHDVLPVDFDRALAFATLGTLFTLAYPRHWLKVALFVLVAAFAIEYLQEFAPSRHARLEDASLKALGAVLGVMSVAALRPALQRLVQKTGRRPAAIS